MGTPTSSFHRNGRGVISRTDTPPGPGRWTLVNTVDGAGIIIVDIRRQIWEIHSAFRREQFVDDGIRWTFYGKRALLPNGKFDLATLRISTLGFYGYGGLVVSRTDRSSRTTRWALVNIRYGTMGLIGNRISKIRKWNGAGFISDELQPGRTLQREIVAGISIGGNFLCVGQSDGDKK